MAKPKKIQQPNPMGRPPHFKNSEALKEAFNSYAKETKEKELPLTLSGFCVYVNSYKQLFMEYADKPEFSTTIKEIRNIVENDIEAGILINKYNATAGIFNLKNNFGWKDKIETENTNHNLNADLSAKELKEEIRKARTEKNG